MLLLLLFPGKADGPTRSDVPRWLITSLLVLQAALVLAANQILTSDPPSTSSCYSQAALFGSWMSNLAFGHTGADAVVWYMAGFGNGRAR